MARLKIKIAILILTVALVIFPKIVFAGNEPAIDKAIQKILRYVRTFGYNISEKDLIISRQEKDNVIDVVISTKITPYKKWISSGKGMPRLAWIDEKDVIERSPEKQGKLAKIFFAESSREPFEFNFMPTFEFNFMPIRDSGSSIYGHKLIGLSFIFWVLLMFSVIMLVLRITDPIFIAVWAFYFMFSVMITDSYIHEAEAAYSAGRILIGFNIPVLLMTILYSIWPLRHNRASGSRKYNRAAGSNGISIRNRKTSLIVPLFLLIELLIIFNEFEADTFVLIMAYVIFGAALLPLFIFINSGIASLRSQGQSSYNPNTVTFPPNPQEITENENYANNPNRTTFDGLNGLVNQLYERVEKLEQENNRLTSEMAQLKNKEKSEEKGINFEGQPRRRLNKFRKDV